MGKKIVIEDFRAKFLYDDPGHCTGTHSIFVIQAECIQEQEDLKEKQDSMLVLACIGIFAALSFHSFIFFL